MFRGSCLCSAIQYSVDGPLGPISHCHCETCRKSHAAAFATVARVKKDFFTIDKGTEALSAYKSTPQKTRYFCTNCGSQIYAHTQGQDEIVLRLGTLDDDPGSRPVRHIFLNDKAPWYDLGAELQKFDSWPE